jgi:TPR repeat protein
VTTLVRHLEKSLGEVVTTSWDNTARLWDVATGASLAVLQGHAQMVTSTVFSSDGARVVTASWDNTARVWDAKTGVSLAVLQGHTQRVTSAAFSPDGARVVTASDDNTARLWAVWPLLTTDTVTYVEVSVLRGLSQEEQASLFLTESDVAEGSASADDPTVMCDRLAGEPFDPHRRAPGAPFEHINAQRAVPACRAAVEAAPEEPRFRYQLGQALSRAYKEDEAVACIRAAAEMSYPVAQRDLGYLYENGSGVAKDDTKALALYRKAAEGGFAPAFSDEGRLYWEGIGTVADHAEAIRWFERGANQGDPFSHRRLAELYEIGGDHLPRNLEKALFHHAVEANLLEAVGYSSEAAMACARRGSLARATARDRRPNSPRSCRLAPEGIVASTSPRSRCWFA